MKRRQFLKAAGVGLAAHDHRQAGDRAVMPDDQVAPDLELPEIARHALWRGGDARRSTSPKRPTTNSRSRLSPPARSCPRLQALDAVQNGTVEMCHTARLLFRRQGPDLRLLHLDPLRPECAPAERLVLRRRRHGAAQRVLPEVQHLRPAGGNTGTQMGGWFRKEIKEPSRPAGPEDAHRRLRRPA